MPKRRGRGSDHDSSPEIARGGKNPTLAIAKFINKLRKSVVFRSESITSAVLRLVPAANTSPLAPKAKVNPSPIECYRNFRKVCHWKESPTKDRITNWVVMNTSVDRVHVVK